MMGMNEIGRLLMVAGGGMFVVGLMMVVGGRFGWFGHLPGDIMIKGENGIFFAPIGTMIVISVLLTIVLNVIGRLFR